VHAGWLGTLALVATALVAPRAGAADEPPTVAMPPGAESFDDRHRPEAEPWRARPFALEAQLGLGAPLGMAGLAFDVSPSAGFGLNVGGGISAATKAPSVALSIRTRMIIADGFALGAEGGLSVTRFEQHIHCPSGRCPPEWHWDRAVFGHLGLLLERRTDSGLALRWSFGAAGIFNVAEAECVRCDETDEPSVWSSTLPYTLISVGWALGP
jgi:hypothetical protein